MAGMSDTEQEETEQSAGLGARPWEGKWPPREQRRQGRDGMLTAKVKGKRGGIPEIWSMTNHGLQSTAEALGVGGSRRWNQKSGS